MKASLTWLRRFVGPLIKAINRKNEAGLGSGQSWVDVRWLLSGGEQEAVLVTILSSSWASE
jgi:hypothetical protein